MERSIGTDKRRFGAGPRGRRRGSATRFSDLLVLVLFGLVGIGACIWGLVRYTTHPRVPALVPATATAPTAANPSEIPAPDVERP
ncbi:MAG: hypothetical protein U0169_21055 [Polyangiaceae bacterium]